MLSCGGAVGCYAVVEPLGAKLWWSRRVLSCGGAVGC